jgi:hypothetical protein
MVGDLELKGFAIEAFVEGNIVWVEEGHLLIGVLGSELF